MKRFRSAAASLLALWIGHEVLHHRAPQADQQPHLEPAPLVPAQTLGPSNTRITPLTGRLSLTMA